MIIGFAGKIAAGKTTAANHLVATYGAVKLSFADAVKEEVRDFLQSAGIQFRVENLWGTQADRDEKFFVTRLRWCMDAPTDLFTASKPYLDFSTPKYVGLSFRELLQVWGTEYRRAQDPDYWVTKMLKTLSETDAPLIAIDDVRFVNEAVMLKDLGATLVRIERPDTGGKKCRHHSEIDLDVYAGWDHVITNHITPEFFEAVREIKA